METNIGNLHQAIFESVSGKEGDIFISHIKNHLQAGEEVICKCCGKTVSQIVNQEIRNTMSSIIGEEATEEALKKTTSEDNGKEVVNSSHS